MDEVLFATATRWRRYLHAHPELSRQESGTAAFVREQLHALGIPTVDGIGGHGLVGTLSRPGPGSVGLRADMDALPITERTGLPHASSRSGVMHACGHDGHTVALLAAATLLVRDPDWRGTIQLVFQPAEEGHGGAEAMLRDGVLRRFPMARIFGFHNWPGLEAGTVALHDGPVMSAVTALRITLRGRAAHGAMPHLGRDPVLAAAQLVTALQSVVSRTVDPLDAAVLSICTLQAGTADNQIPDQVRMTGTCRSFRSRVQQRVETEVRRIAAGIAAAFDMQAEVELEPGAPATINTPPEAAMAHDAARRLGLTVIERTSPSMAGEDFGCFLRELPGCYAWIGNGPSAGLHSPEYDFNDAILPVAAEWLAGVARQALSAELS